jgi:hypothetical protein
MRLNDWSIAASYDTARIVAGLGLHREQADHLAPFKRRVMSRCGEPNRTKA